MKLLLFIVNYRSDAALAQCLASVRQAQQSCSADVTLALQVHVQDNSEYDVAGRARLQALLDSVGGLDVRLHWPDRNNGYFGGLPLAQQLAQAQGSDVVIYSNPDISLASDFFGRLTLLAQQSPGILAPAIVAQVDGFDQNPKYIDRLSRAKLERLQRIYGTRLAFNAYMGLARLKERLLGRRARSASSLPAGTPIYAPHGATLVFADATFFAALPAYPCFLFGEELFIAEEAQRRQVAITYQPTLRITDLRSQSVSQLPSDFFRRLMLSSVQFILQRYYAGPTGH